MTIKIEVDDYEIVDNGTLIIGKDMITKFNFKGEGYDLNFKIRFSENPKIDHSKYETTVNEEENYLEINIINSDSASNMGHNKLIPLAKLNNRQLYLKFLFSNVENDGIDTLFNYTWYLKNE